MEFRIKRAPRIEAEIAVPGDKSISHRAVIIGALSNGVCVLRGFLPSEDCLHTVQALRALGIKIEHPEPDMLVVHGKNDPRVPLSEAEQIVARLRSRGGNVWYLQARDEGHGFRKKQNRDAYYRTFAQFILSLH